MYAARFSGLIWKVVSQFLIIRQNVKGVANLSTE
jgi:hypothetical protein